MKAVRSFLIGIGIWYLINLLLTWPSVYDAVLPMVYPGIDLRQSEPVFGLLLDAWLIVGIQLAAIGVIALWGAREPARHMAIIPIVVATEFVGSLWDIYSMVWRRESLIVGATTLFIHGVIFVGAYYAWRAGGRDLAASGLDHPPMATRPSRAA